MVSIDDNIPLIISADISRHDVTLWESKNVGLNSDSKVHGANRGPTWVLSAPDGPHVGPKNLAIREMMHSTHRFDWNDPKNVIKIVSFDVNVPWSRLRTRHVPGNMRPDRPLSEDAHWQDAHGSTWHGRHNGHKSTETNHRHSWQRSSDLHRLGMDLCRIGVLARHSCLANINHWPLPIPGPLLFFLDHSIALLSLEPESSALA